MNEARLESVADGVFAYLQRGSWGYSNAGLVADAGQSLLVDTLFDPRLTGEMLRAMRAATPAARQVETVVNTHANGDHCWGNQLVKDATIVASRRGAEEMRELPPRKVALLVTLAKWIQRGGRPAELAARAVGKVVPRIGAVAGAADFVVDAFGDFALSEVELVPPNCTFDDHLELMVGERRVDVHEVGPAHTRGDVIVHVPDAKTVFTGDILFIESHPIIWAGPVQNWIDACDRIVAFAPDVIVPGHGPLTDEAGVRSVRDYLSYLRDECRARFEAGVGPADAARDIAIGAFSTWGERERVAVNVRTIYRELAGDSTEPDVVTLFAEMAAYGR